MRTFALAVAAALLLVGCGDDDQAVDTETTTPTTAQATTTTTTAPGSTTTSTTEAAAPGSPAAGSLPGERLELFPYEGDELAVVGVAADDTLNLRSGPGVDFDVVAELEPTAVGVVATGHNRSLEGSSIWAEVTAGGTTAWANATYLAHMGQTDDVTSQIVGTSTQRPRAETMLELGTEVGRLRAGPGAATEPSLRVVVVAGPSVGDLGEITVDVVGMPDDSVLGERLRIFGQPDPGGESFSLRTVEATLLCRRGVSDGICI